MLIVLYEDACEPPPMGLKTVRTKDLDVCRPGDIAIMPPDMFNASVKNKYNLRAVLSCDEDAPARIREILAKDVLVIGRATADKFPPEVEALFGHVCYVKCTAAGHTDERYCCTSSSMWYKNHKFIQNHSESCGVFFPNKWERGHRVASEKPPKGMKNHFDCDIVYRYMPELKKEAPGWLTTGMVTAFDFVFGKKFSDKTHLYMYGFSHWKDGAVVTPPAGMKNAFGRPPGRHSVWMERRAAEILRDTKRVYGIETDRTINAVPCTTHTPASSAIANKPAAVSRDMLVREDVAKLIPDKGICAELGVAEGQFSKKLLERSSCAKLYSIDSWEGKYGHNKSEYERVKRLLMGYGKRSAVVRKRFDEALVDFEDEHFDFIYVDGFAETGQENGKTLVDWWPKLKAGGVFSGDDYSAKHWPQVYGAVNKFANKRGLVINVIENLPRDRPPKDRNTKYNKFPTWWIRKPGGKERAQPASVSEPKPTDNNIESWKGSSRSESRLRTCDAIDSLLFSGGTPPKTMLDIGCGYASEALYFQKKYGTEVWLIEGDKALNAPEQTRATKYGSEASFMFFEGIGELKSHYDREGLRYKLLSPSDPRDDLPRFDLILSVGACGMFFPADGYRDVFRKHVYPGTNIILELNKNRQTEHKQQGISTRAVIEDRQKSRLSLVRIS